MTTRSPLRSRLHLIRMAALAAGLIGFVLLLQAQLSAPRLGARVADQTETAINRWSHELARMVPQWQRAGGKRGLPVEMRLKLFDLMYATQVVAVDVQDSSGHRIWSINGASRQTFPGAANNRESAAADRWPDLLNPASQPSPGPLLSTRLTIPLGNGASDRVTLFFAPAVLAGALGSLSWTMSAIILGFTVLALAAGLAWRAWRLTKTEARLTRLSRLDRLTGVPHRSTFIERLDRLTSQDDALRSGFAIMFTDIRRFSEINRYHGAEAADHVLRVVADRLNMSGRAPGMLARLGGDQFAILLESVDAEDAGNRAERILDLIRQPVDWEDSQLRISANIGLALAPRDGGNRSTLMKHADLALQHAKALGGNRVAVFSPESAGHFERRRELERLVLDAAEDEGFALNYQPIIDMRANGIAGFEALLRLTAKDGCHISPADFVPVLEHLGKIDDVGRWIIERACSFARHWPEGIKVAVNLSPLQFGSGDLPDDVTAILARTGCQPDRLELEVTENLVLDRSQHVRDQLDRLQRMGLSIVLDDFGTGYSSLSYLCQFSFDKIKIDQEFIRGAGTSARAHGILRTIAAMARRFDLQVTAEGVETPQHAALVRSLRFRYAQGYLFSRPMPESEAASLMLRNFADEIAGEIRKLPARRPRLALVGK